MINTTYIVSVLFFVSAIAMGQEAVLMRSDPSQADGKVVLSVDLSRSKKEELRYTLKLRNDGPKAVYYSTNPQDGCGRYGPYVSLDQDDSSIVDIQWRVFHREIVLFIDCYTNETGVELKRLEAGQSVEETVSINWPLEETVPPYLSKRYRKLERSDVKRLRFTVGYFDEEKGILEFLTRKPFGWFIKGNESIETGVFQGKRFYEIQRLVSSEVSIPELAD